ncbi:uncharacterized protein BDZ99DRAFT_527210 [Mytilinidion resinicola]|uniref:Uncharacterized protein n=1 Tax=Mytilinidion resinicola TaxID=574789 RepID=A0A6A6Y299_9PEZI|nr:uncharacterized protein BDZ99DRAFT_527210 [Mytilinidion resinicola]KAF2802780.1 hypothetical protein BDZ99DRAFT_527210 [Mytilinidion resinicola]
MPAIICRHPASRTIDIVGALDTEAPEFFIMENADGTFALCLEERKSSTSAATSYLAILLPIAILLAFAWEFGKAVESPA